MPVIISKNRGTRTGDKKPCPRCAKVLHRIYSPTLQNYLWGHLYTFAQGINPPCDYSEIENKESSPPVG